MYSSGLEQMKVGGGMFVRTTCPRPVHAYEGDDSGDGAKSTSVAQLQGIHCVDGVECYMHNYKLLGYQRPVMSLAYPR